MVQMKRAWREPDPYFVQQKQVEVPWTTALFLLRLQIVDSGDFVNTQTVYFFRMLDFMNEFVYGPTIEYIPCDLSRRCP